MSLADNILRRRQELEGAFRPRYNPMESVVSALSDIEKAAFERQGEEAKRKYETERQAREAEKFGLEKTETEARTKQLQAQTERDREERIALANQREARRQEFLARAAAQREEAKRKAQEESARRVAQQVHGYLQQLGLTTKDIFETKPLDKELRGVVEARGGETAATKTGTARDDITKMADVTGMSPEELMMRVQELETGAEGERQKLALIGEKAKTEQARQRELDRRRRAAAATSAPDDRKTRMQELAERKAMADTLRAEEKLARDRMASGAAGQFALTESQRTDLQHRRTKVLDRATAAKGIRDLLTKYPEMESYVGTIDQYISKVRSKLGNSKAAEILSALGRASDEYRTAVTGAAASDKEREMLESRVPNAGDSVAAILGKLAVDDEYFKNKLSIIDGQLDANDIRGADSMLGIASPVATAPAKAPAATAAPKGTPSAATQRDITEFGLED